MNKNYIYLTVLLLVIAAGVLFLPMRNNSKENQATDLLQKINSSARLVSTDQVAEWIIEQDPSLLLIDVRRDINEDSAFMIEGAIHIPLNELLDEKWEMYLNAEGLNKVFYSYGDIDAEKAWVLAYRKGYENIYFLKGGLNCWAGSILNPKDPGSEASNDELDLYSFRKGASLYFKGGEITVKESKKTPPPPKKVVPKKVKKKVIPVKVEEEEEEGGC